MSSDISSLDASLMGKVLLVELSEIAISFVSLQEVSPGEKLKMLENSRGVLEQFEYFIIKTVRNTTCK